VIGIPSTLGGRGWGPGRPHRQRGWRLVAILAVTETTSYGVLAYAFGVFLVPMGDVLGWSRTALTGAYALAVIVSGVAAIPVGRWLDGHGARALMTAGSTAATVLVLAWAQVSDLTVFYAIWTGIGLAMAAVLYEPAFVVIATWFPDDTQRRRALLTLTVIAGFASVIYVPLAGWLVQAHGWRHALIVLAALLGILTVIPHASLPGRRPDQPDHPAHPHPSAGAAGGAGVPLGQALRDRALWWLAAALVAATLATTTVTVHLVAYLREQHYSAGFAATWTGLIGAGSVGGRILVTTLSRRWPLATTTAAIFAVQALAVALLVGIPGSAGVVAFVALFGLGVGLISLARAALVAEVYGLAAYASINGVLALPLTLARAGAPVAAAVLHTATGSYGLVMAAVALCSLAASLAMAQAHRLSHRQQIPSASSQTHLR
jgi:predicted MFS family arabinose efflux permease